MKSVYCEHKWGEETISYLCNGSIIKYRICDRCKSVSYGWEPEPKVVIGWIEE